MEVLKMLGRGFVRLCKFVVEGLIVAAGLAGMVLGIIGGIIKYPRAGWTVSGLLLVIFFSWIFGEFSEEETKLTDDGDRC